MKMKLQNKKASAKRKLQTEWIQEKKGEKNNWKEKRRR